MKFRVKIVKDKESTGLWNEYVSRYHYLGYKNPFSIYGEFEIAIP